MSGETTNFKIKYSTATDEVEHFPAEVSEPGMKTIDKLLAEHLLKLTERAAEYNAASGDWVKAAANIKVNLPTATANSIIAVSANNHTVTVGAGAALIYGDFITGATPITLVGYQHVLLEADGTNWHIIAGEPKREQAYAAWTSYAGTEVEPSSTRPAFVTVNAELERIAIGEGVLNLAVAVGGVARFSVRGAFTSGSGGPIVADNFLVPPGIKWKAVAVDFGGGSPVVMHQQTLLL